MNTSSVEIVLRSLVAVLGTFSSIVLVYSLIKLRGVPTGTPQALMKFLAGVMIVGTSWRWFILWLGFQNEPPAFVIEWMQPMNAAMLFLLYLAITLIVLYHSRRVRGRT